MKHLYRLTALMLVMCALSSAARDSLRIDYSASVLVNASTGNFAPYMIGSWNSGRIVYGKGIWQNGAAHKAYDRNRRFSWGAGVEYIAGYGSAADYEHYNNGWTTVSNRQAPIRLIQLYGELKYRGVFLLGGMKERGSIIVDNHLSMGDVTRSTNARPIPGLTAGFIDFQDVPFTNGWVQINGELMYGRFFDSSLIDKCFNRYNGLLPQDAFYHYKYCYFRSNPRQPFSVIAGAQEAALFGGSTVFYRQGVVRDTDKRGFKWQYLWNSFFPEHNNGELNAIGSSVGSWDFKARYLFRNRTELSAYFEWFWEDGSGLAKRNGFDGLWGLQLKLSGNGILESVVAEYIDFTNQAGPVHHWPADYPGTDLTTAVGGADNYYNNDRYGPYAYYGMAIGTPFLKAPIYNTDGDWQFANCRTRGIHVAAAGQLMPRLSYTVKFSTQKAWGTGRVPAAIAKEAYCAGVNLQWQPMPQRVPGFTVSMDLAFDAGRLRGNNFGTLIGFRYDGALRIR